jgi:hypothetical protein
MRTENIWLVEREGKGGFDDEWNEGKLVHTFLAVEHSIVPSNFNGFSYSFSRVHVP